MSGILGRLFGTEKAIENITDKKDGLLTQVGGWIGNFSHTDEEKAEDRAEIRAWGLKQLEALAPFKVVQRILAFSCTFLWIFVGLNVVVALWVEALYPEIKIAEAMLDFATSQYVFMPVSLCYILYFGGGAIESLKHRAGK